MNQRNVQSRKNGRYARGITGNYTNNHRRHEMQLWQAMAVDGAEVSASLGNNVANMGPKLGGLSLKQYGQISRNYKLEV